MKIEESSSFSILTQKLSAEDMATILSENGYGKQVKECNGNPKELATLLLHNLTSLHKYETRREEAMKLLGHLG